MFRGGSLGTVSIALTFDELHYHPVFGGYDYKTVCSVMMGAPTINVSVKEFNRLISEQKNRDAQRVKDNSYNQ